MTKEIRGKSEMLGKDISRIKKWFVVQNISLKKTSKYVLHLPTRRTMMYLLRTDFLKNKNKNRTKSERKLLKNLAVKPLKGNDGS